MSTKSDNANPETVGDLMPQTPDLRADRLAALRKLFPDLFDGEGRLQEKELLALIDPTYHPAAERYEFPWTGKTRSKREAFTPSRAALVYDKKRSVNPDKAGGNVIIEGENLEVLKQLTAAYRERVKLIYIDPPYNTGKDFVYSDDYTEGRKPYWEESGVTERGVKVDTNSDSEGRFHSNWLSMMHARLLAARYLLKPEGVIFVSINDIETANLRRLLNEVFGEENFLGMLVWKGATDNNPTRVATEHEYIVCYARDIEHTAPVWKDATDGAKEIILAEYERLKKTIESAEDIQTELRKFIRQNRESLNGVTHYDRVDDESVYTGSRKVHNPKPGGYFYDVPFKDTDRICDPPVNGYRFPEAKMDDLLRGKKILFGDDEHQIIQIKEYLKDYVGKLAGVITLDSRAGSNEITDLFGVQQVFTNPKPTDLLKHVYKFVLASDDVALDFFGGSGTTAQAVMELNAADGGNRRFILVQLPEFTKEDSAAHKAGYKKISDITIERNKRVIDRYCKEAEGLLPNDLKRQYADSLGFKVYTLEKSHFPRVDFAPDPDKTEAENVELLRAYIKEKENTFNRTWDRDRILDEVLIKNGFMFDRTIEPSPEFTKNKVEKVKDVYRTALVCLDEEIATETVDAFKQDKERTFICLEAALDTTKKWNLKHHLGDRLRAI